ncbi:MAG: hypothetical protein RMK91_09595 [Pseudanabaenaceae cyanobacterium SKYGB_i_bin29]|nr:hypothetical protein [Pseudanabaenaceae cyanobacterium SKYG29]MDW8422106.1 hypothetical protein [Pseudanabaenaceae cyanobacterium SKYGB_i_bin29]
MNAIEKVASIELASKIATVVNLFRQQFPAARVDLSPWTNDPETRRNLDPDSIDFSFSFPGVNRQVSSRCILVQLRFQGDTLIGIDAVGFGYQGKQWSFSTIGDWEYVGTQLPAAPLADRFKQFCRDVYSLFLAPGDLG